MRAASILALLTVLLTLASCAPAVRSRAPHSVAGRAAHGEIVAVPWGTVDDWNILVSPLEMGAEEPRSENDNRLLAFRVSAGAHDRTSWRVVAEYKFGYALNNADVHWVAGSASYLVVRR